MHRCRSACNADESHSRRDDEASIESARRSKQERGARDDEEDGGGREETGRKTERDEIGDDGIRRGGSERSPGN